MKSRVTDIQQRALVLGKDTIRKPNSSEITACSYFRDSPFLFLSTQKGTRTPRCFIKKDFSELLLMKQGIS